MTYDTIIANIIAAVPELTSSSNVAIYKKIAQAVAISLDNTKTELDNTISVIDNIIGSLRYGRNGYYVQRALGFQYGDSLTLDPVTLEPVYATIDTTKQIVKQAAFKAANSGGTQVLTLKVAKLDSTTGLLVKLATAEKSAFDTYFLNFEIPGLPMTKVSFDANVFNFNIAIVYYSSYDITLLMANVAAAIATFRDTYLFDGTLYTNDLETYLKNNVPGIRNVSLTTTTIDSVTFSGNTELLAGYFNYDSSIATKIADITNYTAI
jgi:hypothetical protein